MFLLCRSNGSGGYMTRHQCTGDSKQMWMAKMLQLIKRISQFGEVSAENYSDMAPPVCVESVIPLPRYNFLEARAASQRHSLLKPLFSNRDGQA